MSFRVASRGSGSDSSRAGFSGSGGVGSMAMSISGSGSASSVVDGGCWVEESAAEIVFGEAMVVVDVGISREILAGELGSSFCAGK